MKEIFPGQSDNYMSWEFNTIYRHQNFLNYLNSRVCSFGGINYLFVDLTNSKN